MTPEYIEALHLAKGFAVFPLWGRTPDGKCECGKEGCSSPCKHPIGSLVPNGVKDATKDLAVIRRWWRQYPNANIAVATGAPSGVFVLDVDGPEGEAALAALEAQNAPLPVTYMVRTGKGRHIYFQHLPGLKNSVRFAPGLDTRSDGGYVVGPGSVHANGSVYEAIPVRPA